MSSDAHLAPTAADAGHSAPPHRPARVDARQVHPLHGLAATRAIERASLARQPRPDLMRRAGESVARLAMAIAPHARRIWIAAGPGNNGGDGLQAAATLRAMGHDPVVTRMVTEAPADKDLATAVERAREAGVRFADAPPQAPDLVIDALLGIGATRAPEGRLAEWIERMNASRAPVLAVDLPSGLDGDTGSTPGACVRAQATLSLLTLKPGLFTGRGRDHSGQVWLDGLGVDPTAIHAADALLLGRPSLAEWPPSAHKGDRGDVAVVGGAQGMRGAALLAARSALHRGAGRVYLAAPDQAAPEFDPVQPELMVRSPLDLDLRRCTIVCGCGGGDALLPMLPALLAGADRLVLDADALQAIARDPGLARQLRARGIRGRKTVLTPHPLEAARLGNTDTATIQRDRPRWAMRLAEAFACIVLLKGSGSILASPQRGWRINPTGNARLASAGTGDVLAGAIGALWAGGLDAYDAAAAAAWLHGHRADEWPRDQGLTANTLATTPWT